MTVEITTQSLAVTSRRARPRGASTQPQTRKNANRLHEAKSRDAMPVILVLAIIVAYLCWAIAMYTTPSTLDGSIFSVAAP